MLGKTQTITAYGNGTAWYQTNLTADQLLYLAQKLIAENLVDIDTLLDMEYDGDEPLVIKFTVIRDENNATAVSFLNEFKPENLTLFVKLLAMPKFQEVLLEGKDNETQ